MNPGGLVHNDWTPMLHPLPIPGLFITGTDTGVGKTVVAGAIAQWFVRRGLTVAVCKPAATGCVRRREGLVSEDAELLAYCADTDVALDVICPQRFVEPLAPAVAAERAREPIDWALIDRDFQAIVAQSDCIIVEGVGGIMVPLDRYTLVLDVARELQLPAVVVARPGLGTISHTLLTVAALRDAGVEVAGVVINGYPAETPDVVEETNPRAIERWGKVAVLCLIPKFTGSAIPKLPADVVAAVEPVAWDEKSTRE